MSLGGGAYQPVDDAVDFLSQGLGGGRWWAEELMTSFAISPFTMPAALAAADDLLGGLQEWKGGLWNRAQKAWLKQFRQRATAANQLPEISRHATESAAQHVAWLRSHHWEADLQGGPEGAMFLAAVLAIGGKWTTAGHRYVDKKGLARATVGEVFVHDSKVARMQIRSPGVEFLVCQFDAPTRDEHELQAQSLALLKATQRNERMEEGEVDFPLVDLRTRADATNVVGLQTSEHIIARATEGFELKMNHLGGQARARAEIEMVVTGPPPRVPCVKITGPFVVAVIKQGLSEPVFAAYVDKDSWRDPGDESV